MKAPVTPAIRFLRQHKVHFEPHLYRYEPKGGTAASARELGVAEEQVVKTLVFQDSDRKPLLVLMDGVHEVSLKKLARDLSLKSLEPCKPEVAQKHTGCLVGGTSPFGIRKDLPVYLEEGILKHPIIYINGGKRGFLVALNPNEIVRILKPSLVRVGI